MNADIKAIAEACTRGSESGALNFPQVLGRLAEAGIEAYWADLRRAVKIYYLPNGDSVEIAAADSGAVAAAFDAASVESAIRQSQAGAHTYHDFCRKIRAAGCAAYFVSLPGRRAVYFGRTGEAHVEHFPAAQ